MTVLSDAMGNMLNAQAARELHNNLQYLAFSSWAHNLGLKRVAAFFKGEADGERGHADKFMDYLRESNTAIMTPTVEAAMGFTDCESIAMIYAEAEADTTRNLKAIWQQSETDFDIGTQDTLQWFLAEQVEEEGLAERFAALVGLSNGDYIKLDLALGE